MKTTNNQEKLGESLQELLQKNYDAEKGFKQVMQKAENPQLKSWLQKQAAQRSQFANEIDNELRNLNFEPRETGTVKGSAHRMWIDVKTALSTDKDESILEECIRGEKASVEEYSNQLESNSLPPTTESLLNKQKVKVQSSLATVKTLEDLSI